MTQDHGTGSPVRVLVVMPLGRVGSNLLMAYLSGFKGTARDNESFAALATAQAQLEWLQGFYCPADITQHPMIVCKQSLRSMAQPLAVEEFASTQNISVIRVFRRDIARTAISHIRAKQLAEQSLVETGHERWGVRTGEDPLGATRIDIDHLDRLITRHKALSDQLSGLFLGCQYLDIFYEDMAADIPAMMGRVSAFLGIEERPFETPFVKATPDDLWEVVINRDELADYLDRKGFSV